MESGERLPCLVETATWFPVRVATRWAVRYQRYRVQSSTLTNNLRVLARVYRWAHEAGGIELDSRLTRGDLLRNREIESLVNTLRTKTDGHCLDTGAFDHHLAVVEDFLKWSLDSENRGGDGVLTLEQLAAERGRIENLFRSLRIGARPSERIEPLEEADVQAIRRAIGPNRAPDGELSFPTIFSAHTRLRNWLMFEVALELGIRRGELLKLRLDSLPRGSDDGIRILRRPDDPHDSRVREPAVKTAERAIPASRELLSAVRAYVTYRPPLGRISGNSPYLFVTRHGRPVSLDTADDIIAAIGRCRGVTPLSCHRLRHTWAERMADVLADQPNGMDRLIYLGGWTNPLSARHYIQRALAKQAKQTLREYHRKLYGQGEGDA
jgi:integrase